jgi:hypothetical protein
MHDHRPQVCLVPSCFTAPHGYLTWCRAVPRESAADAAALSVRRPTHP